MPITPLHVGPGLLIKLVGGRHLSLTMFVLTQITMDLEVLMRLMLGAFPLHGFTNTILGATAVLAVTIVLGKPVCEWALHWWNRKLSPAQSRWLRVSEGISWTAACLGGISGGFSHFVLDAMMHADAKPWMSFYEANPFLGLFSIDQLNLFCLVCLFVGVVVMVVYGVLRGLKTTTHFGNGSDRA